jgi:hypothetical protein
MDAVAVPPPVKLQSPGRSIPPGAERSGGPAVGSGGRAMSVVAGHMHSPPIQLPVISQPIARQAVPLGRGLPPQAPALQVASARQSLQLWPHEPQLFTSLRGDSQPLVRVPSQSAKPTSHVMVHASVAQVPLVPSQLQIELGAPAGSYWVPPCLSALWELAMSGGSHPTRNETKAAPINADKQIRITLTRLRRVATHVNAPFDGRVRQCMITKAFPAGW